MTLAGKALLVTGLGQLASMGGSYVYVAPLRARGSLTKTGWLSCGRVVAATSPRREVRPSDTAASYQECALADTYHVWQHLSSDLWSLRNRKVYA